MSTVRISLLLFDGIIEQFQDGTDAQGRMHFLHLQKMAERVQVS